MSEIATNPLYQSFTKTIETLTRCHDRGKVFNDFLTAAICSYHRTNIQSRLQEQDEENEKLYMYTISKYTKKEIQVFPKLAAIFAQSTNAMPYSDILGQYFTEHVTQGQNGQFFTPPAICELMARMHGEPGTIIEKTVADPACGSSRLLLAFAKNNPNNRFYGTDNSNTCAKMATLNFFINGLRGEVGWMNTLSMEWYGGWRINEGGLGILPIKKEQSIVWSRPAETHQNLQNDRDKQLSLFY